MNDINKRRRQAAWICFEPYLAEEQLFKAIHILERGYQTDSVSNSIAYIGRVCSEFDIGSEIRKSLYGQFHKLMSEGTDLRIDSLALALKKNQAKPRQETAASKPVQASPAPVLSMVEPLEQQDKAASLPPHIVVFSYFMIQLIAYLPDKPALFEILMELTKNKRNSVDHISRWASNPDKFDWAEGLDEKTLASLVHRVYTAFCEIMGPVAADECFHKAMAACEQKPESRRFSPARFL
jgi:hypothetical protein